MKLKKIKLNEAFALSVNDKPFEVDEKVATFKTEKDALQFASDNDLSDATVITWDEITPTEEENPKEEDPENTLDDFVSVTRNWNTLSNGATVALKVFMHGGDTRSSLVNACSLPASNTRAAFFTEGIKEGIFVSPVANRIEEGPALLPWVEANIRSLARANDFGWSQSDIQDMIDAKKTGNPSTPSASSAPASASSQTAADMFRQFTGQTEEPDSNASEETSNVESPFIQRSAASGYKSFTLSDLVSSEPQEASAEELPEVETEGLEEELELKESEELEIKPMSYRDKLKAEATHNKEELARRQKEAFRKYFNIDGDIDEFPKDYSDTQFRRMCTNNGWSVEVARKNIFGEE